MIVSLANRILTFSLANRILTFSLANRISTVKIHHFNDNQSNEDNEKEKYNVIVLFFTSSLRILKVTEIEFNLKK